MTCACARGVEHGDPRCGPFERRSNAVSPCVAGSPLQSDSLLTTTSGGDKTVFEMPAARALATSTKIAPRENRTSRLCDPRHARTPLTFIPIPALSPYAAYQECPHYRRNMK